MNKEQIRQRWAKMPEGPYHFSYMRIVAPKSEVASEQDPKLRPGVWSWERFHAETLANARQDIHDLLTALDVAEAKAITEERVAEAVRFHVGLMLRQRTNWTTTMDNAVTESIVAAVLARLKEGK